MIPRVLHQIWLGGPFPDEFARYRQLWLALHPGWEHHLWTDDTMIPLRNQALYDAAEQIAPGSEQQFRADGARYEILAVYGGVYADTDMEPLRPIDELLGVTPLWFCYEDPQHRWVNNAV